MRSADDIRDHNAGHHQTEKADLSEQVDEPPAPVHEPSTSGTSSAGAITIMDLAKPIQTGNESLWNGMQQVGRRSEAVEHQADMQYRKNNKELKLSAVEQIAKSSDRGAHTTIDTLRGLERGNSMIENRSDDVEAASYGS